MGFKTKITFFFATLATVFLIVAMCTPWWYTKSEPRTEFGQLISGGAKVTVCFIDGTCRQPDKTFKDNGDAQVIYDLTMTFMILSWVPFLIFLHVIMFRWSDRYEHFTSKRWLIGTGILTFILILMAILLFGTQVYDRYGYDTLYGSRDSDLPIKRKLSWGAHVGWYFAMASLLFLLPAMVTGSRMKNKKKAEREVLISERRTTAIYAPIQTQ